MLILYNGFAYVAAIGVYAPQFNLNWVQVNRVPRFTTGGPLLAEATLRSLSAWGIQRAQGVMIISKLFRTGRFGETPYESSLLEA